MLRADRERLVGLLVRAEQRLLELRETADQRKRDRAMEVANLRLAIDMLGRAAQSLAAKEVPPQFADGLGGQRGAGQAPPIGKRVLWGSGTFGRLECRCKALLMEP